MAVWIAILGGAVGTIAGVLVSVFASRAGRQAGAPESEQARRLRLLEQALERPDLDADTRNMILRVLGSEARRGAFGRAETWARVSFGVGWIMFLIAGGFLLLNMLDIIRRIDDDLVFGLALLGLALLTMPLGLREFISRDRKLADQE